MMMIYIMCILTEQQHNFGLHLIQNTVNDRHSREPSSSLKCGEFLYYAEAPERSPMDGMDDNAQGLPHCTCSCLPLQPLWLLSACTKWVLSCGCYCQHSFKQNGLVSTEASLKDGGRCGRGWSLGLHFVASVLLTVSVYLRTLLHQVGGFTTGMLCKALCKAPYAQKEVMAYW